MERYTYPHAIDNGAGESIVFLRKFRGAAADRLEVENVVGPGSGPPMHIHHYQDEALTIEEGRMGFQTLGEEQHFAGVGETVTFKAGEPHRFWNAGDGPLRCLGYIEPADNIEYFLTELYDSTKRNGGKRPDLFEAAFLTRRYRNEFAMVEIPAAVQRFLFPLQVAIGKLLGKYGRYGDAPRPVQR
ncbi:MAG: cupin domain-containing protein [Longimicrobiales bacterium]